MTTLRTHKSLLRKQVKGYAIQDARRDLNEIFQEDGLCEGDWSPACCKAMSLLTMHPQLAKEWFAATDEDLSFRFLPLSIFVASGASRSVIEAIHKLNPKAVSTKHPELKLYPLQAACEVHADDDVIAFLVEQFPQAVETRDYNGDLVIHSVLNQDKDQIPRRKTIETLLNIFPQGVRETNSEGACPLAIAFRNEQGPKVLDKIIQTRHAQGVASFTLLPWKDFELEAKDVSRLSVELFPKLQLRSFRCEPERYTRDGFNYLMESLSADESIERLTLAFPALGYSQSEAFLGLLRINTDLRSLTLTRNLNMWGRGTGMDSLLQGLDSNQSLQTLRLSGLFLMSSFEVGQLISRAPMKLVLNAIMVDSRWRAANHKQWGSSRVWDLTIRNCKMRGSTLDKLLEALVHLQDLRRLTLDFSNPEDKHDEEHLKSRDVTKPILALLKKGQLESLVLHGLNVDVRKLTVKLHKNNSLVKLHIDAIRNSLALSVGCLVGSFIKGNTTLEDVKFHCDYNYDVKEPDGDGQGRPKFEYVEDPAINYYTNLNRSGNHASLLYTASMTMPHRDDSRHEEMVVHSKPTVNTSLLHQVMTM